jgi:6-pyruvoyltetrahydropterin/6-carboxytetrahydropterin synthase
MLITRRVEFSASHVCRVPSWSDDQNRATYGEAAHPHGHGHNYLVEVSVGGVPDPITGMIIDLKDLKQILEEEIVEPMDHRFLNHEVKPFDTVVPTAENVALEIWRRLNERLHGIPAHLHRVRLYETADLYVDVVGGRDAK